MTESTDDPAFSYLAYRFADFDEAGKAYEEVRDLVFRESFAASVYRVIIGGVTHVVVVGEAVRLPRLQNLLPEICAKGEKAEVDSDKICLLVQRRAEMHEPNGQIEIRRQI